MGDELSGYTGESKEKRKRGGRKGDRGFQRSIYHDSAIMTFTKHHHATKTLSFEKMAFNTAFNHILISLGGTFQGN